MPGVETLDVPDEVDVLDGGDVVQGGGVGGLRPYAKETRVAQKTGSRLW
jgi:hypothetical protein